MSPKPGDILDKYVLENEVGRGGMATVYRAFQPSLHRDVAVKVLPDFFAQDPAFRERFAREAATIARLRHPSIVAVHDYGEQDGTPYIVTEFVEGEALSAQLGRPFSVSQALVFLRPLASALDYAHECGVIHRDVKPSNVLVGRDGTVVLTDFGLSRITGSLPRLTHTGTPLGTPEYMAPELANGDIATPAVDLYALGVIAYEMLTGRVPFSGETPLAVLLAHLSRPLPPPSRIDPSISIEVEAVILKSLEKDPEDRYPSAYAFVEALAKADETSLKHAVDRANLEPPPPPGRAGAGSPPAVFTQGGLAEGQEAGLNAGGQAFLEAVQQPLPLLLTAAGTIGIIYLLFLAPVLGYGWPVLITVVWFVLAAGAIVLRRLPREYAKAEAHDRYLRQIQQRQREYNELKRLHDMLNDGFLQAGGADGRKALAQLKTEFEQVQPSLTGPDALTPLSMSRVPSLTFETYQRGLSVLVDALALTTARQTSDVDRLRREIRDFEKEVAGLVNQPTQAERLHMRQEMLESHRERLRMLDDLQLRRDQLLFQAQRCEASLHRTRIDLAAINTGDKDSNVDAVIETLQRTIEQAKAVQAEIRSLGY